MRDTEVTKGSNCKVKPWLSFAPYFKAITLRYAVHEISAYVLKINEVATNLMEY